VKGIYFHSLREGGKRAMRIVVRRWKIDRGIETDLHTWIGCMVRELVEGLLVGFLYIDIEDWSKSRRTKKYSKGKGKV
jgi:hypothetical protein